MEDMDAPWLEAMISGSPDGLIHTIPIRTVKKPPKQRGAKPKRTSDDADICLTCPMEICELETKNRCKRYSKIRREKKNETL